MNCPKCGVWTSVLDTRNRGSFTTRRRECANGHKFTTEEHVKLQNLDARKSSGVRLSSKYKDDPAEREDRGATARPQGRH
jgi:transcriptional regulator NrdR family protein